MLLERGGRPGSSHGSCPRPSGTGGAVLPWPAPPCPARQKQASTFGNGNIITDHMVLPFLSVPFNSVGEGAGARRCGPAPPLSLGRGRKQGISVPCLPAEVFSWRWPLSASSFPSLKRGDDVADDIVASGVDYRGGRIDQIPRWPPRWGRPHRSEGKKDRCDDKAFANEAAAGHAGLCPRRTRPQRPRPEQHTPVKGLPQRPPARRRSSAHRRSGSRPCAW